MNLIKYKDDHDPDYSWFWVHDYNKDGREVVVSSVFQSEEAALAWGRALKEQMNSMDCCKGEMNMLTKEKLFRELYKSSKERDAYIDAIPNDIKSAFFDNSYVNSALMDLDMLIYYVFGDFAESIFWFLNEWEPGFEVSFNEETAIINNIDEYIVWLKNVEIWEA
jgi:hypothetical protein